MRRALKAAKVASKTDPYGVLGAETLLSTPKAPTTAELEAQWALQMQQQLQESHAQMQLEAFKAITAAPVVPSAAPRSKAGGKGKSNDAGKGQHSSKGNVKAYVSPPPAKSSFAVPGKQ